MKTPNRGRAVGIIHHNPPPGAPGPRPLADFLRGFLSGRAGNATKGREKVQRPETPSFRGDSSAAAARGPQNPAKPRKMPGKDRKNRTFRAKTAGNAPGIPDFAPGDTRGGPQCRGNARKRPPKPPIWRGKGLETTQKTGYFAGKVPKHTAALLAKLANFHMYIRVKYIYRGPRFW